MPHRGQETVMRDGDARFAPVALAGYTAAHTLGDLPIEQASKFTLMINLKTGEYSTA